MEEIEHGSTEAATVALVKNSFSIPNSEILSGQTENKDYEGRL